MASTKLTTQIRQQIASNNPIETGKSAVGDFSKAINKQVRETVGPMPDDFFNQLLGYSTSEKPAEEKKPQAAKKGLERSVYNTDSTTEASSRERKPAKAAAIEYHAEIARSSERGNRKESQELQHQIQQIMDELQRLVSSSNKIIKMTYGEIGVSSAPKVVGKYHTNFLTWMLTVVQTARQQVEDSGAWLSVAKRKGGLIDNAWKKGNTSVTMSNERQVATQSG